MMKLREIKRSVRALTVKELVVLDAWLHNLISVSESKTLERRVSKQNDLSGSRRPVGKTYRLQVIRCGKEICKCAEGNLHGPYWYAYWSEGGRTRSLYIGKRQPKGVKPSRETKLRRVR